MPPCLKNTLVMKKYLIPAVVLFLFAVCFASCKKECICTVTRTTPTTIDTKTYEMGKMDEKDCQEYTGNIVDGDGVSRTLNCALE